MSGNWETGNPMNANIPKRVIKMDMTSESTGLSMKVLNIILCFCTEFRFGFYRALIWILVAARLTLSMEIFFGEIVTPFFNP